MLASRKRKDNEWQRARDNLTARDAARRLARWASLPRWLIALLCAVAAGNLWAQGRFEVRSAYVEVQEGVYQLNATLDFELPEGARAAIREGVPLTLDLEIVVRGRGRALRRRGPDLLRRLVGGAGLPLQG